MIFESFIDYFTMGFLISWFVFSLVSFWIIYNKLKTLYNKLKILKK
jgi:hypothetical protein